MKKQCMCFSPFSFLKKFGLWYHQAIWTSFCESLDWFSRNVVCTLCHLWPPQLRIFLISRNSNNVADAQTFEVGAILAPLNYGSEMMYATFFVECETTTW